jgi:hypothetical protein
LLYIFCINPPATFVFPVSPVCFTTIQVLKSLHDDFNAVFASGGGEEVRWRGEEMVWRGDENGEELRLERRWWRGEERRWCGEEMRLERR